MFQNRTSHMLTPADVAKLLERPPRTIAHIAAEHDIGTKVNQRLRLYTERDVAKLRKVMAGRKVGRPRG